MKCEGGFGLITAETERFRMKFSQNEISHFQSVWIQLRLGALDCQAAARLHQPARLSTD